MLTDNHIREGLSRAFILAVAHRAGLSCSLANFDYGVDGTLNEIQIKDKRHFESGFCIDFQAKASGEAEIGASEVVYDLEAQAYNDLVNTDRGGKPFILIVLALPADRSQWLEVTADALLLRRCAFWISLRGQSPTTNSSTQRIKIPRANVFDVNAVRTLMERHKAGEVY